jgi:hypothetical protein
MFHCDKCNKNCTTKSGLNRHTKSCGIEKDFTCEYCKETFSNKQSLNRHNVDRNCKKYIFFIEQEFEKYKEELKQKEILLELQAEQIKKLTDENRGLSELYQKEKIRSDELINHYKQLNTMINLLQK